MDIKLLILGICYIGLIITDGNNGQGNAIPAAQDQSLNVRVRLTEPLYRWSVNICNYNASQDIKKMDPPAEGEGYQIISDALRSYIEFGPGPPNCTESLGGSSGSFRTPKTAPDDEEYHLHSRCIWVITVPEGSTIKLVFNQFALPLSEISSDGAVDTCDHAYVEVFDDYTSSSSLTRKLCGRWEEQKEFNSTSNVMIVYFESGVAISDTGFRASFTEVPGNKITGAAGNAVLTPSWPTKDLFKYISEPEEQEDCVEKFFNNLNRPMHNLLKRICEENTTDTWWSYKKLESCKKGILLGCSSVLSIRPDDKDLVVRLRETVRRQCRMECLLANKNRCVAEYVQKTLEMILTTQTMSEMDCKEALNGPTSAAATCLAEDLSSCAGPMWTGWYQEMSKNLMDKSIGMCKKISDSKITLTATPYDTCKTADLIKCFSETYNTSQMVAADMFTGSRFDRYTLRKVTSVNSVSCLKGFKTTCSEDFLKASENLISNYLTELVPKLTCELKEAQDCITRLQLAKKIDVDEICGSLIKKTKECKTAYTESCQGVKEQQELKKMNKTLSDVLEDLEWRCKPIIKCDTNELTLVEGGPPESFHFHIVPDYHKTLCQKKKNCRVFVDFYPQHDDLPRCKGGRSMKQFGIYTSTKDQEAQGCSMEITEDNWTENKTVMLAAKEDFMVDEDQVRKLHVVVRVIEKLPKKAKYKMILKRTETSCTQTVIIKDRDDFKQCTVATDPQIYTFDNKYYPSLNVDKNFILYRHTELPIQVHAEFRTCGLGSCACAVVVNVLEDVYYKNVCPNPPPNSPPAKRKESRNEGIYQHRSEKETIDTMRIYTREDDRLVLLPHGGTVFIRVRGSSLNIHINPSTRDFLKTQGLCGTYDNNKTNDLVWSNGEPVNETRDSVFLWNFISHYPDLVDSWSVKGSDYSQGTPTNRKSISDELGKICDCEKPSSYLEDAGAPVKSCDTNNLIEDCSLDLSEEYTKFIRKIPSRYVGNNGRRRRAVDSRNVQIAQTNPGNWTLDLAETYCKNHLRESETSKLCSSLVSYKTTFDLKACIADIMFSGGTEFVDGALDVLKQKCDAELRINVTFSQTDAGKQMASKIRNYLCAPACAVNGTCENGECRCEVGYAGSDCSQSSDFLPVGVVFEDESLCDSSLRSCSSVLLSADLFVNTKLINCSLQSVKVDNNSISNSTTEQVSIKAKYLDRHTIACLLPESVQLSNEIVTKPEAVTGYMISVSNNGVEVMKPKLYVRHDSRCHTCRGDLEDLSDVVCVLKEEVCFINGEFCYEAGEKSPENSCLVCLPQKQRFQLSNSTDADCTVSVPSSLDLALLMPLIMLSLIFVIIITVIVVVVVSKKHFGTVAKKFDFQ